MAKSQDTPKVAAVTVGVVTLTLTEELLGTSPANPDLLREYIASKRPEGIDEAEVEAIPEVEEELQKSMTVFPRDEADRPFLYDYQLKGFFKDACGCLRRVPGTHSAALKSYKKVIDGLLFVEPRRIIPAMPEGTGLGACERPLRAQTAQGERVSIARSETIPAGTVITFDVRLLGDDLFECLDEWLAYGKLRGLGQWRNSGKGRFSGSWQPREG